MRFLGISKLMLFPKLKLSLFRCFTSNPRMLFISGLFVGYITVLVINCMFFYRTVDWPSPFIFDSLPEDIALKENVRILCWVLTTPKNTWNRAIYVNKTWGPRCNILLFISSHNDTKFGTIGVPVKEGLGGLWNKTKAAFSYAYAHYLDKADWFMKADDDTYVIVENLRYFLANYKTSDPVYFGYRFKPYVKQGYMSGGAGYVLSRESLKRLVEVGIPKKKMCGNNFWEDKRMGECLQEIGVVPMDTRDSLGRNRFFPILPSKLIIPGHYKPDHWIHKHPYYPQAPECCSDSAISFHYVRGETMLFLDLLIYHVRPHGRHSIVHLPSLMNNKASVENGGHNSSNNFANGKDVIL